MHVKCQLKQARISSGRTENLSLPEATNRGHTNLNLNYTNLTNGSQYSYNNTAAKGYGANEAKLRFKKMAKPWLTQFKTKSKP